MDLPGTEIAKEGVKAAAEEAGRFLQKLVGPPLEEVGGLLADQVRFFRFKNQVRILQKAQKFLSDMGMNPHKVPLKTLVPILEHGSLEEEESMVDRWAALLANAADGESRVVVRPSFPELLKELSPTEAVILDKIFDMVLYRPIPREEWPSRGAIGSSIKQVLGLTDQEFEIAIDNLYRLQLCSPPSTKLDFIDNQSLRFHLQTKEIICLTDFGFAFVSACRPPTET